MCQDEDMSTEQPSSPAVMAHPVADRLDTLMAVLMAYIKDVCHDSGELDHSFYTFLITGRVYNNLRHF